MAREFCRLSHDASWNQQALTGMLSFSPTIPVGRRNVSTYKLCLGAGIYFGMCASIITARRTEINSVRLGLAELACAVLGLIGARIYHLILFRSRRSMAVDSVKPWDASSGGGGLFGGLVAIVFVSPAMALLAGLSFGIFWDYLSIALVLGVIWGRFGCFCNGCCGGRETVSWFLGLRWHDHRGEIKKRIPIQLLEIGWMLLSLGGLVYFFPRPHPEGAVALGVLAWYGAGRFILEPWREEPDIIGSVRINQVIAGAIALGAGSLFLLLQFRHGL